MAFVARPHFDWQLRTRTLALGERTSLMAIVNLTPDSFSGDGLLRRRGELDGSGDELVAETEDRHSAATLVCHSAATRRNLHVPSAAAEFPTAANDTNVAAIDFALAALDHGADILDLGAESTRPNAASRTAHEEQQRLLPVLAGILRLRPDALISVDTYHSQTARAAVEAGAEIINDVSGLLWDPEMAATLAGLRCGVVLMHTRGRPQEWSTLPPLAPADVLPLVLDGLTQQLAVALRASIAAERIVLDPGFGFGKIGAENFVLLAGFDELQTLGRPLLAGLSRKGFLGQAVGRLQPKGLPLAEARLQATTAANVAAMLGGAHILRVHDVQAAREAAAIVDVVRASDGVDYGRDMQIPSE
jgi:dihydropteroate synthase